MILVTERTRNLLSERNNSNRKAVYCDIAEWTANGEMVVGGRCDSDNSQGSRCEGDNVSAPCSSSSSSLSSSSSCSSRRRRNGGDPGNDEYIFSQDDLERMHELRDRQRRRMSRRSSRNDGGGGGDRMMRIDKQLAEFQKSSTLSRMFAELIVNRDDDKYRYILDRLNRMVKRRDKPLLCRHDTMLKIYHKHLNAYQQVSPAFMNHILQTNVIPSVSERYRNKNPLQLILLHLINATPSVTLSQFYFFVFGKNYCFGEVCEFFMNLCEPIADSLFVQRTRFILQRYQRLGDGRATSILDKMCVCEMVLFPILIRRRRSTTVNTDDDGRNNDDENLDSFTTSDDTKMLQNGACSSADELYDRVHERTDVLDLAFEFVRDRALERRQKRTAGRGMARRASADGNGGVDDGTAMFAAMFDDTADAAAADETLEPRDFYDELIRSRDVLELSNFLHWRYDGSSYLDPGNDELVIPRNSDVFAKYIGARYLSYVKECTSPPDNDDDGNIDEVGEGKKSRRPKKKSYGGAELTAATFRTGLTEVMEIVGKSYRGSILGGIANSITGNNNDNTSRESGGQGTSVGGLTLDKFVRYVDKRTTHKIVLNLYLNRFELSTPAMSRVLIINYDDANPPQRYRFNEVLDRDINRYVHCAIEHSRSYFAQVCSRDTINHYLYSEVVPERISIEESEKRETATTATTAMDEPTTAAEEETTSTATTSILRQFDRPFTCEIGDLTCILPQMLMPRDAANILLRTHPFARVFTVIMLNVAHSFDLNLLRGPDSVRRIMSILVDVLLSQQSTSANLAYLLYAPLGCRSQLDASESIGERRDTVRRLARDVFSNSRRFLRKIRRDAAATVATSTAANNDNVSRIATAHGDDEISRNGGLMSDADVLRLELKRRRPVVLNLDPLTDNTDESTDDDEDDSTDTFAATTKASREAAAFRRRRKFKDLISAEDDFFIVPPTTAREHPHASDGNRQRSDSVGCPDAIRNYLASWGLHEFARDHADDSELEHWILSAVESADSLVIVNLASAFLFLLTRERERRAKFITSGNEEADFTYERDDDGKIKKCSDETMNDFARLTDTRCSLFDECYSSLCQMYPECNIHSYDTNSLAGGLTAYVTARPEGQGVPSDIAYSLSVAIVSLYIFSRGDKDIMLFFLHYVTAIRFPGQFLKSILMLQGTSDSGKSDLVSEVIRAIFSCILSGTISNATLKQGIKDEVNTDLMSMMKSHVCQVDEPEKVNAELFKNLVSTTMMKSRYFHQQQSQYLRNLAKIIVTVNDAISLRSDAGVITRLKFCLRMVHRFKPLHNRQLDTAIDFGKSNTTPSVSYQFATRCFARGVNFTDFRTGLFLAMEHYGVEACTYNDATYGLYDAVSARLADVAELMNTSESSSTTTLAAEVKNDLMLFRKMLTFNLTKRVIAMYGRCSSSLPSPSKRHRLEPSTIECSSSTEEEEEEDADDDESENGHGRRRSSTTEDENDDDDDDESENEENAVRSARRRMLPSLLKSKLVSRRDRTKGGGGSRVTRKARFDARMRNRSVKIFHDTAGTKLDDPVLFDELPRAMVRDAHNLHVMIDPFESLQQQYRIYEDSTVLMRDTDLYRFIREFVEQSGYLVSRVNFREIVIKIKERIKTDYPNAFNDKTQTFHLTFVPKK